MWEMGERGRTRGVALLKHEAPVLCAGWSADGSRVFSGGCDNIAKMWHPESKREMAVAKHDAPIKELAFSDQASCLLTGSWDKSVRVWDVRTQAAPKMSIKLPERVYCMDVVNQLMVVGTADRQLLMYDLRNPEKPFKVLPSPLKFQSRCLAAFADLTGFALGSIEGRVAIQYLDPKNDSRNFAFKCHRQGTETSQQVFAVNALCFHPKWGTFATAGSDGCFTFWDKDTKQRLKLFPRNDNSITSCHFNRDGTILAYSLSYDWSKGIEHWDKRKPNAIMLHPVNEEQIKPRPAKR